MDSADGGLSLFRGGNGYSWHIAPAVFGRAGTFAAGVAFCREGALRTGEKEQEATRVREGLV